MYNFFLNYVSYLYMTGKVLRMYYIYTWQVKYWTMYYIYTWQGKYEMVWTRKIGLKPATGLVLGYIDSGARLHDCRLGILRH